MSYLDSLKPNAKTIVKDAVSGFSTGLFSIPEGMAYAQLAGVNPVYGLYSGMVATIVAAMSTGTILMISTLTSAIALSTGSVLESAGLDASSDPSALFTITFLVGTYMFVMGLLRLGGLMSFVSNAVMTGFVAGASLLIIIGELGDFSGYDPVGANDFAEIIDWITNIGQWDLATTAVGTITVVMVLVLKRIKLTKKMASIIVLLLMSVVVYIFSISVELVGDIATIPSSLPAPTLPDFSLIPELALGSLSVALVALVQGAGISTAYPNPDKTKASTNRDFVGEGLGNLFGSFFQSMSTGGSLSRTGISVGGGAKSRWGGILAGIWLAIIVLLFGPLAELVPLTVIAGLLFVIGAELILARVPSMKLVVQTSWGSTAAMVLTFVTALLIPLQWTIFLGAGLSLVLYVYASSKTVRVHQLVRNDKGMFEEREVPETYPSNASTIISIGGQAFFAEVPVLEEELPALEGTQNAVVIFRLRGREHGGSTGLRWLERYQADLKAVNSTLMLSDLEPVFYAELEKIGVLEIFGKENVFKAQPSMGGSLIEALDAADKLLAARTTSQAVESLDDDPAN